MTADKLMDHGCVESPVTGSITKMAASQCLNVIIHAARMKAFYEAQIIEALARFADLRPPGKDGKALDNDARKLLSAELAVSPRVVDTQVRQSRKLVEWLPATLSALAKGEIDQRRALAMVDLVGRMSKEDASRIELTVLEGGARANYRRFRESVRQELTKVDADAVARRKACRQNPDVSVEPCVDGMSKLTVDLTTQEAVAARARIDTLAKEAKVPGDTRTDGQRRVAVLVDLVVGDNGGEHLPDKGAISSAAQTGQSERRSEPAAHGSVCAVEHMVDAAHGSESTNPTVHVLDVSHHRYALPTQFERGDKCQIVGCRAAAEAIPIADDDDPNVATVGTRCAHHKVKKQHVGWTFNYPAPGVLALTSPDGRTTHAYAIAADQYLDPPA
ncbi:DUF222 domain-containing protein [Kibdelosporangium aridum]|uniref:DUF222 domain-containing protein n=1 Tax=Kibdelosporangium aridum TaxID=2030 RepID=A0A428Z3F6_KIBAR|nr:DUF222 domain-containing protein [Kibdelosporangium aridum]RSM80632.1 DUF222 domain-containing protein [Kibdelosporangium aridum]